MILSRSLLLFLVALSLPVVTNAAAAKAKPTRPAIDNSKAYKGAIVMDAATGNILFEDRADIVSPPASMTKLMTFAVLHDKLASSAITLTTPVRITNEDAKMGGTQVYLDPRETFPVEELIYAMMIQSANDAAHALARAASGSVESFVAAMNAKAQELGMTHTTFRSPHGLPPGSRNIADGDLTSPRDYALLCRYLVTKTDVLKYTSVRQRDFGTERASGPQHMKNHNNLLGKVAGVDGLKTGYTEGAGYCLSTTAERNGHRLIVVVMGSFGPGGQHDLGKTRDIKAIELLERGFTLLPPGSPTFVSQAPKPPAEPRSIMEAKPATTTPAAAPNDAAIKFAIPKK
jgi:D-alanyl-D-alanine carboxypeptidase